MKSVVETSDYFNTIATNEPEHKLVKAIIDEEVKVVSGSRVRLRLLDDIFFPFDLSYEEHKNQDLNEAVLDKYNWYYLNIFITNDVAGHVYIVDGQQRLTTLTLIAAKLYHLIDDNLLKNTLKDCIYGEDIWKGNIFRIDSERRKNVMNAVLEESEYTTFANKTEE